MLPIENYEVPGQSTGKQLYDYQKGAIEEIFDKLKAHPSRYNLLYQLPTGGGKTVIFSEITRRFIANTGKKVMILTHRVELCNQTSRMLNEFGVNNKVISNDVKELPVPNDYMCFVAMVETLNNRLRDKILDLDDIGLMIVDEAHYNSFGKLFKFYEKGVVLGVTATPLSSNINLPMRDNYDELIVGESISSLVKMGFLSKATTYSYHVGLSSLKIGINGDYTVSSSERLYTNHVMQDKLLSAYREKCLGKKTLIFNNGIATSQYVYASFHEAGYDVRHLDNTNSPKERRDILQWFRDKPDAILTSVSILTTGFDEPTVECIMLNRATRSLTLYFQMIGRGSRVLSDKSEFIGVAVREQDGVDARDAIGECLLPQIGGGIDQDRRPAVDVDVNGRPRPPIARVGRLAHGAGAADHRHAMRGATAKEGDDSVHLREGMLA